MLDNFLNQLRNNPRLRWGVTLIAGIIWLYGILLLRETLQEHNRALWSRSPVKRREGRSVKRCDVF